MTNKQPFTKKEDEIMQLIVNAHNKFIGLERVHPDEIKEWVLFIHGLQHLLVMRVAARDYPDYFAMQEQIG